MQSDGLSPGGKAVRLACMASAWLVAAAASADPLPMWAVKGTNHEMLVLGSIHFLKPGQDPLPEAVLDAYRQADVLLMEIDLDDLDPAAVQRTMRELGVDPQGRRLDILLGEGSYRAASAKARQLGLDLGQFQPFEPWMAAIMISQMQLTTLGYEPSSGVEQQLLTRAAQDQKPIRGLESLEEQLSAMDNLPAATQREFLLQTLDDAATMSDAAEKIVVAWKRGDTAALQADFLDGIRDYPQLYDSIVVKRNRNWAQQMEPLLRDRKRYLVVVGTLHLVGPDSLLRMLEQSGHPSRQLQSR